MRLAVLHHSLTGYSNICLKALHAQGDVKIFLAHRTLDRNTPFDPSMFTWVDSRYEWKEQPNADQLIAKIHEFKPDLLLTLGGHYPADGRAARSRKGAARRVLLFDTTWRGTPKQWLGIMASPVYVRPLAELAWVPGSLQRDFARRLGFADSQIIDGYLSGDSHLFETVRERREQLAAKPRAFLFVGRLVKAKGVRVLLKGYAQYRSRCADPWPLICVGSGPLGRNLASAPGVVMVGFLQPEQLAEKMLEATVFVLPSLFEPWGVVVNEAASAGMPMIVSEAVGSHVHLVQSGFNGFVVEKGSPESLANAMLRFHGMNESSLLRMGKASEQLSKQYTPERWASTLRRIASDLSQ
jgi:glycosyltransferase involved in cell wall biosynthesis